MIKSTATLALPGVVAAINNNLPGGVVVVRGHADVGQTINRRVEIVVITPN